MFVTRGWLSVASVTLLALPLLIHAQQSAPAGRRAVRERIVREFDKNGDGTLSQEERSAARAAFQNRRVPGSQPADSRIPDGVKVLRDVEYARVDGQRLLLDIYLPKAEAGPLPVVVWIHGGGWQAGSKEMCVARPLSGEGYAVVSINYRLSSVATFPAQIHDCKGAIRWVRAHAKEYGFNPDRVGVWGSSAGGHLVALLGTSGGIKELEGDVGGNLDQSSRVQAVCDFCGPSTFRVGDFEGEAGKPKEAGPQIVQKLLGGPLNENREKARLASPVEHVSKDDPPFLIVHGEQDKVVPVRHSRLLAEALKRENAEVTLHILPDAGHGVGNAATIGMAARFFDKHLKAKPATRPADRAAR